MFEDFEVFAENFTWINMKCFLRVDEDVLKRFQLKIVDYNFEWFQINLFEKHEHLFACLANKSSIIHLKALQKFQIHFLCQFKRDFMKNKLKPFKSYLLECFFEQFFCWANQTKIVKICSTLLGWLQIVFSITWCMLFKLKISILTLQNTPERLWTKNICILLFFTWLWKFFDSRLFFINKYY